jgi:hypothetical protein
VFAIKNSVSICHSSLFLEKKEKKKVIKKIKILKKIII